MEEFSTALIERIHEKNWNQSDLARAAKIGRDAVSTYINRKALPSPFKLRRIAEALGCQPEDLLPTALTNVTAAEAPVFSMVESPQSPGMVMMRVNKLVTTRVALKVYQLIQSGE